MKFTEHFRLGIFVLILAILSLGVGIKFIIDKWHPFAIVLLLINIVIILFILKELKIELKEETE